MKRGVMIETAVAAASLVATLGILAARGFGTPDPAAHHLDALGVVLAALTCVPLAVRHRAPAAVFAVSALATLALLRLGYPLDAPVGLVVAAYGFAVAHSAATGWRRVAAAASANAFVPAAALAYLTAGVPPGEITTALLGWAAVFAGVWIAGDRHRLRAARLAEAQAHARRLARDAERERHLAAAHERMRIARELHDSAGHAINVILVQAGAARLLHERNPGGSRRAIETVEEVARQTIGDIDRMVRTLREDEVDIPADPGALDELVQRHRAGGLDVAASLPGGDGSALPRNVAWAAYRILQEALTNAARHGSGAVTVTVRFEPACVEIDVTNRADDIVPSATGGHGIIGMRERAALLGGTLDAGLAAGMFRLRAVLPFDGVPA
jgi:signal transduction histidine kinase